MAEIKFDQALQRLEKIVEEMEREELPLEESLKKYEEGIRLAQVCMQKLQAAEKKVEVLKQSADGKMTTVPFDGPGKGGEGPASPPEGENPLSGE